MFFKYYGSLFIVIAKAEYLDAISMTKYELFFIFCMCLNVIYQSFDYPCFFSFFPRSDDSK